MNDNDRMDELYEELINLVKRIRTEKGEEAIRPFTEKWDNEWPRAENVEWMEQFKKEMQQALGGVA